MSHCSVSQYSSFSVTREYRPSRRVYQANPAAEFRRHIWVNPSYDRQSPDALPGTSCTLLIRQTALCSLYSHKHCFAWSLDFAIPINHVSQ